MIIHLAIIGGILIVGGIVLYPYEENSLPLDFDLNQAKNDLTEITDDTINTLEETLENTYDKVSTSVDETFEKIG